MSHDSQTELSLASKEVPVADHRWLFSMPIDLLAFGGSAFLSLALLAIGWRMGILESETPEWTWITSVLLIDVAHVYATGFRVYFIPSELRRRLWLYTLTPLLSFVLGVCLYSESELLFWRCLAYIAVFHFVRQQAGWVALYRAKLCEQSGRWLDLATIYGATVWPLIWWHEHLPRRFWWFHENDFVPAQMELAALLQPLYWSLLLAYGGKSIWNGMKKGIWNPGKDLVVGSTALCWYVGIVGLNSDYAFTVTNVLIHGIPYIVLVQWLRVHPGRTADPSTDSKHTLWKYLGLLWILAYCEEYMWDRGLWHEHSWIFGSPWTWEHGRFLFVPLLAVPQLTHYILDGFIWKRRTNPELTNLTNRDVR